MPTSPPTSPVDICNLALDAIAEKPISTIEEPTNSREEIMARWYDHVRRTTLRDYVWNFCQKYYVATRSGDGDGGYDDAYAMPNDLVRLNSVGSDRDDPITDYEIFGREIHASNGNSLPIWYNRNVTEVAKMDAGFVDVFALRLALKVAYKFSKKTSLVNEIREELKAVEPKATSVDGQERIPRRRQKSKYLSARRHGGSLGRNSRYYDFS